MISGLGVQHFPDVFPGFLFSNTHVNNVAKLKKREKNTWQSIIYLYYFILWIRKASQEFTSLDIFDVCMDLNPQVSARGLILMFVQFQHSYLRSMEDSLIVNSNIILYITMLN